MARNANPLLSTEKGLPLVQKVGDFRLAACFPGDYAWGMSSLGYQSLLRLVFEAPYWRGERFFSASGPFSVETGAPLASFDVLAFSLSFELDVFRLVTFLQEGRVPLFTHQRDENDPWVIVGGPLVTLNPEIVAPFVDFAFIGEGEEIFPQILALWREGKRNRMPRLEMKKMLSSLPGVYVPEGVIPIYRDGDLVGFEKREGFFFPVLRQVTNLELFDTRTFIYAPSAYFRETALIEVNRGCAYRCRFCAGRYLYFPLRQRSFQLVQRMLESVSGWTDRIGLVGSDVLSYPELEELLRYLMVNKRKLTCSSLSGLRLRENQSLLTLLRRGGLRTLTIAPESGSCRLRRFLGKNLQDEEWKELVEQAVKVGFDRVKLYFILGKPGGGVEEDLEFLQNRGYRSFRKDGRFVQFSRSEAPYSFAGFGTAVSCGLEEGEGNFREGPAKIRGRSFRRESPFCVSGIIAFSGGSVTGRKNTRGFTSGRKPRCVAGGASRVEAGL